jgi:fumarate hydratase subunit beta
MRMTEYRLKTPIREEDIRRLKVGDVLYVSGRVITARDEAHRRAVEYFEEGKEIPVSFEGNILYHCGPVVKKIDDRWIFISAGPTTSTRMEYIEPTFIKYFKPRVIVGKGGLKEGTLDALRKYGAVYTLFPGGLGAKAALSVKEVIGVEWLDLGSPEALWILEVESFGPLIVTMDTHGNSIHKEIEDMTRKKLEEIVKKI